MLELILTAIVTGLIIGIILDIYWSRKHDKLIDDYNRVNTQSIRDNHIILNIMDFTVEKVRPLAEKKELDLAEKVMIGMSSEILYIITGEESLIEWKDKNENN